MLRPAAFGLGSWGALGAVLLTPALGHAAEPTRSAAGSETPPIASWEAPSECPTAHAVLQRLSSIDHRPASVWSQAGAVRGSIQPVAGSGWRLELEIEQRDTGGQLARSRRVLSAPACDELADAAAVAIVIALGDGSEPEPASDPAAPAPAPAAPPAAAPVDTAPVDTTPRPATAPAGGPRLAPSAALVLDSASLGGVALGPSVQLELRWPSFGVGLYGLWLPSRDESLNARQGVEFALLAGGTRACYLTGDGRLRVDVCAGFELGALSADGSSLAGARTRSDAWLAPSWGALLGWRLIDGLSLGARLEAVLPLGRERYVVDGDVLVHEVPETSIRLGLVLGWSPSSAGAPSSRPE